jgi:hypothetical protein
MSLFNQPIGQIEHTRVGKSAAGEKHCRRKAVAQIAAWAWRMLAEP